MDLGEILDMWENDCIINKDPAELKDEIIRLHTLHSKYLKFKVKTAINLIKKQETLNILYNNKFKFYKYGPVGGKLTEEERELNPQGKVILKEVDNYISADPQYIKLFNLVEMLKVQKDALEDIIKKIYQSAYYINGMVSTMKFLSGE
jgi:hypothetical protein